MHYRISVCLDLAALRAARAEFGSVLPPWAIYTAPYVEIDNASVAEIAYLDDEGKPPGCLLYETKDEAAEAHPSLRQAIRNAPILGGSGMNPLTMTPEEIAEWEELLRSFQPPETGAKI